MLIVRSDASSLYIALPGEGLMCMTFMASARPCCSHAVSEAS